MGHLFLSRIRTGLVYLSILGMFAVLFGRLFYLHVWEHDRLLEIAENNRRQIQVIPAQRGNIVDARGNLLAATRTFIILGMDPHALREGDREKWPELARLAGINMSDIDNASRNLTRPGANFPGEVQAVRWVVLARDLDEDTYDAIRALGVRGVYGNRNFMRAYPGRELAAHVLGFINREEVAVTGIERVMDFYLRGQSGFRETERDGRRRELAQFRGRQIAPTTGLHVQLTLDQTVQSIVEREIERIVNDYSPQGVSIIVSEPSTGAILAMGNYPSFDPNRFWEHPVDHHRNRSLTDVFEPGSTFKIVPAAAALNEGLVREEDVFATGDERVEFRGRVVRLPSDHRTFPTLTTREIVVKSSNRGVAHFGMLLGERRLYDYSRAFGFGESSGLGLGGEVRGILHPVHRWDGLTITRLPMGHAISATPIQVHQATSAIANRGILMTPRIIERVFDQDWQDVFRSRPEAIRRVVSAETALLLSDMLVEAVSDSGTARQAQIQGFRVAGKTGTTQKLIDGRYSNRHHVASFSGFFPADNPDLVITVIVDEPNIPGTGYGGRVAAPAFRNIAEQLIPYRGIRPVQGSNAFIASNHP